MDDARRGGCLASVCIAQEVGADLHRERKRQIVALAGRIDRPKADHRGRDVGELDQRARREDARPLADVGAVRHLHDDAFRVSLDRTQAKSEDNVAAGFLKAALPVVVSDHLPVYQLYIRRDPKTRIPYEEKSVFGKYREVDGVLIPWNIQRFRDDHKIFEMFGRRAQINGKVNAKAFDLDKRLPILPPSP